MPQLTISAAAKAAGVDRSTIQRKIKDGIISVTLDAAGNRRIDTEELLRVFGELKTDDAAPTAAMPQDAASCSTLILTLQRELEAAKGRETLLLNLLAKEQDARRDLEQRMLPPGSGKGFWARLFGRG